MAASAERHAHQIDIQDVTAHASARDVPDVLYIMGTGRSGTTILEVLLANNEGFAGVGEVKHIFRDGFIADHQCSCGRSTHTCEMWSSVMRAAKWTPSDISYLADTVKNLESHQHFPLLWAGVGPRKAKQDYFVAARDLFRSVGQMRRCKVVVDSSKFAGRALLLAEAFPERIKVLCITRSAEGLIKAFAKQNETEQKPKGPLAAAAYYIYVLLCMRLVKSRLGKRCFAIRFEDLNRDPQSVFAAIEEWSGYSLRTTRSKIDARELFDVGHIVTGNRLRKKGRVKFEPSAGVGKANNALTKVIAPVLELYRRVLGF